MPYVEMEYGPNRYAWLIAGRLEVVVYDGADTTRPKEETEEDESSSYAHGLPIRPLRLQFRRFGMRPFTLGLTYYTVAELTKMRDLINRAFDIAMERAALLDEAATKATLEGNDAIPRTYRPDPEIIERPHVLTRPFDTDTV